MNPPVKHQAAATCKHSPTDPRRLAAGQGKERPGSPWLRGASTTGHFSGGVDKDERNWAFKKSNVLAARRRTSTPQIEKQNPRRTGNAAAEPQNRRTESRLWMLSRLGLSNDRALQITVPVRHRDRRLKPGIRIAPPLHHTHGCSPSAGSPLRFGNGSDCSTSREAG